MSETDSQATSATSNNKPKDQSGGFANTLKKIDIFGMPRPLSIQGEETHKTYLGAVFAISFIFCIVFASIYYGLAYRKRADNPTIKAEENFLDPAPELVFRDKNFFVSLTGYIGGNVVKPDELLKTVNITFAVGERITDIFENSVTEILQGDGNLAVPCTPEHFQIKVDTGDNEFEYQNLISEPHFSDFTLGVCPNIVGEPDEAGNPTKKSITLTGISEAQPEQRFVRIIVAPCKVDCRPDADTLLSEKGLKLVLGYAQASVNEKNFYYPYKHLFLSNIEYNCYQARFYKRKYYMKRVTVETQYEEWFQAKEKSKQAIKFSHTFVEDKVRVGDDSPFIELDFYTTNKEDYVVRKYISLSDTLSLIGGVASAISSIIAIVYGIYNSFSMKIHLINHTVLKNDIHNKYRLSSANLPKIFLCKICIGMKVCTGCFSQETKVKTTLFFSGSLRVFQYLDIKSVVENIRDVRVFKNIFLNKHQKKILNTIERETLLLDENADYFNLGLDLGDSESESDLSDSDSEEEQLNKKEGKKIFVNNFRLGTRPQKKCKRKDDNQHEARHERNDKKKDEEKFEKIDQKGIIDKARANEDTGYVPKLLRRNKHRCRFTGHDRDPEELFLRRIHRRHDRQIPRRTGPHQKGKFDQKPSIVGQIRKRAPKLLHIQVEERRLFRGSEGEAAVAEYSGQRAY
jgi:hypothetical protein